MNKQRIQTQFGPGAADYATSAVHAHGASLDRLLACLPLQPHWRVLDVATGAGHTAHLLAPHVQQVLAADLTLPMLAKTRQLAQEKGMSQVWVSAGDAEALPFAAASFDLVTCRLAAHHFPEISRFLAESARVLKPGGLLAVVDNVVPGSRLRGKKARLQREAGRYINAFEKLRDPSHHICLSLEAWQEAFSTAGFSLTHQELLPMTLDFAAYTARMRVLPLVKTRLQAMLFQAPPPVLAFLTPSLAGDRITFRLTEAILIGISDQ